MVIPWADSRSFIMLSEYVGLNKIPIKNKNKRVEVMGRDTEFDREGAPEELKAV